MKEINLNNVDICDLPNCNCGANINLGFKSKEDLKEFIKYISKKYKICNTIGLGEIYKEVTKKFLDE